MQNNYSIGTIVKLKKEHPCKNSDFEIVRVGVDIKIRCIKCNRTIIIPRIEFNKKIKKVLEEK